MSALSQFVYNRFFERIADGIKNKISGRKNFSLWSMRNRLKREIS